MSGAENRRDDPEHQRGIAVAIVEHRGVKEVEDDIGVGSIAVNPEVQRRHEAAPGTDTESVDQADLDRVTLHQGSKKHEV